MAVVAAISTMYAAGDLWWPGTLLLYSPRWVVALPLAPLALAAVCFNRRAGVGLMLIAFVLVWFGMGFEVRGMLADDSPHRDALTVMSCNCAAFCGRFCAISTNVRSWQITYGGRPAAVASFCLSVLSAA